MAVKIRLARHGAKKNPYYRIVVADERAPRDGRLIEEIGRYNPLEEPPMVRLDLERVDYWVSVGAQPSDTVKRLIEQAKSESQEAPDVTDDEKEEKTEETEEAQASTEDE